MAAIANLLVKDKGGAFAEAIVFAVFTSESFLVAILCTILSLLRGNVRYMLLVNGTKAKIYILRSVRY